MTVVEDQSAGPPPPGRTPTTLGDKVRFVLRGLGQTLITLGLVVLLFVVYEVWITNIAADRNNRHNVTALRNEVDTVQAPPSLPGNGSSAIPIGQALGILYIPRFGGDYAEAIVQGDTVPDGSQLEQGTAHYGDTQLPGQVGNFAIAGHRVGKGEPFLNVDKLRSGDPLVVETKKAWYVYRVLGTPAGKNPQTDRPARLNDTDGNDYSLQGRTIIEPSDGDVLAPVPDHPDIPLDSATDKLMTMTTCHPKFTASHRMIIFSKLVKTVKPLGNTDTTKASQMPPQIEALYKQGGA